MDGIISFRDNLKRVYAEYGAFFRPFLRFLLGFSFLMIFRNTFCENSTFEKPLVILGLSVLCAFFPAGCVSFVCAVYLLGNLWSVSYGAFLFGMIFFLLVLMLYIGLRPGKAILLSLVPVAFLLKIPYLIPVVLGLIGGIGTLVPLVLGCGFWFVLDHTLNYADGFTRTFDMEKIAADFLSYGRAVLKDEELFLVVLSMAVCILAVYVIRQFSVNHAWTIAVVSGVLLMALVLLLGEALFDIPVDWILSIGGLLAALVGGILYELLFFRLNYRATEHLQFEDNEYYYYVKAVPKVGSSADPDRRE